MSRRDFARFGAIAGGLAVGAPAITSIKFASKVVGTPSPPVSTGGSTLPPPTTEGTIAPLATTTTGPVASTTSTTKAIGPRKTGKAAAKHAAKGSSGALPFTGSDTAKIAGLGAAAIVAGRVMHGVTQRHKADLDEGYRRDESGDSSASE